MSQVSVKSPCVKDCNFDEKTNTCSGCKRTVEEFRNWRGMTEEEKQEVINRIQSGSNSGTEDS
jgi:hypothetical protein